MTAMTKTALVTGASSGIGKAISEMLVNEGYTVYGIGRCFKDTESLPGFIPLVCDLTDEKQLKETLSRIPGKELDVLVNNAGAAYYGMHETLSPQMIRTMTEVNLTVPMILTGYFLRDLRHNRGTVINIVSVTAVSVNTHGAAYGAAKAGLLSFSESLFAENRKYGVRVASILPDMTDTALYRNADFMPDDTEGCSLKPEDTAEAVRYILSSREGTAVTSLTLRPQYHRIRRKK
jgi:short-subunit dehydrogenase